MSKELDRIKSLAGIDAKEPVAEKIELNTAAQSGEETAKAGDVTQAMKMAKLKKTVEDRDNDDTDFTGIFTGVARGSISLDDKGKIAEATFGIIKSLEENCGKKHKKKIACEEEQLDEYDFFGSRNHSRTKDDVANMPDNKIKHIISKFEGSGKSAPSDIQAEYDKRRDKGRLKEYENDVDDINESIMFPKGSFERDVVELIVEEMKTGKNAEEISEELAFSFAEVEPIYNHFKKKVAEGYTVLPNVDMDRYPNRDYQGLEGPFRLRSGKVVYYDPKEGKYYDSDSDLFMSHEDYFAHEKQNTPDMEEGYPDNFRGLPSDNEPSDAEMDEKHNFMMDKIKTAAAYDSQKYTDPRDRDPVAVQERIADVVFSSISSQYGSDTAHSMDIKKYVAEYFQ